MKQHCKSVALLAVQFGCIAWVLATGFWFAAPPWIGMEIAGIAVLVWAVFAITPQRMTPMPEPRANTRLVTRGPYRWVRHPMYSGVLLIALALVLDQPTFVRLLVWLVLLVDLILKLEYEETLLARRFPEYAAYRKRTKRLIPRVY